VDALTNDVLVVSVRVHYAEYKGHYNTSLFPLLSPIFGNSKRRRCSSVKETLNLFLKLPKFSFLLYLSL
jgi:hypothetical protein